MARSYSSLFHNSTPARLLKGTRADRINAQEAAQRRYNEAVKRWQDAQAA